MIEHVISKKNLPVDCDFCGDPTIRYIDNYRIDICESNIKTVMSTSMFLNFLCPSCFIKILSDKIKYSKKI